MCKGAECIKNDSKSWKGEMKNRWTEAHDLDDISLDVNVAQTNSRSFREHIKNVKTEYGKKGSVIDVSSMRKR